MWFGRGMVTFLAKKNSERAELPKMCISFGGSMQIAQIKRCYLSSPPPIFMSGDNFKWWWQKPHFGDPHGCLVGKYKQFYKKNSAKKMKKKFFAVGDAGSSKNKVMVLLSALFVN